MGGKGSKPYGTRDTRDKGNLPFNPNEKQGREFSETQLQLIEDYAKIGLTVKDIADALFISFSSFQEVMRRSKTMVEDYDKGGGKDYLKDDIFYINPWYRWQRGKHTHKITISKGVLKKASEGNIAVLLHLAKTRLGWSESLIKQNIPESEVMAVAEAVETKALDELSDDDLEKQVRKALETLG